MGTPKLAEVLSGHSPSPWTLPEFKSYLEHNYCSETLLFITAVSAYRKTYEREILFGHPLHLESSSAMMRAAWENLLATFIVSNSPQEINIPGAVRERLLGYEYLSRDSPPPSPDLLMAAYNLTLELINGIYLQFIETAPLQHPNAGKRLTGSSDPLECDTPYSSADEKDKVITFAPANTNGNQHSHQNTPFYRRAHELWGASRVYHTKRTNKNRSCPPSLNSRDSSPSAGMLPSRPSSVGLFEYLDVMAGAKRWT